MPLVLDLLRHGAALPAGDGGDEARSLSADGARDLERLAVHLANLRWCPDRAFTSPLRRARESARIALRRAAPERVAEVMEALRPECEPAAVLEALAAQGATDGHVLLVGHQPQLGELAAWLTRGSEPPFPAGTLVRIAFPGEAASGGGTLRWRLRPEDCA